MKHFRTLDDISDLQTAINEAIALKKDPLGNNELGKGRTLGLLFFNSSLRTRLSTRKAADNLGLHVMDMDIGRDGWALEFADNAVMNKDKAEHIKEAAQVIAQYCDIIGIRAFAGLKNKKMDESEYILQGFERYSGASILSLESALSHPLQAFADAITIAENRRKERPKVVLSWAPHPRALPHAVANSFVRMAKKLEANFVITHPEGYELDPRVTAGTRIEYDQEKALEDADFVYVKNWCSYADYGKVSKTDRSWMMTPEKLGTARFMHCLPVRRNVVVSDAVLDSPDSLVIEQAKNRTYAAQWVLKQMLEAL